MYGSVDFWQPTKIQPPKFKCLWMCGHSWLKEWLIFNPHKDSAILQNLAKVVKETHNDKVQ
jgi:hypothetical protein